MNTLKVTVIDYESGNLRSVCRALEQVGARAEVIAEPQRLLKADAIVLPGVGSGEAAMKALDKRGLVDPLKEYVALGRPFLGVCLGMQLLLDRTKEGDLPCLGVVPGEVERLPQGIKVPHMGWNQVNLVREHMLFQDIPDKSFFYFVHSYYPKVASSDMVVGTTEYGVSFCSVLAKGNLIATQFHPEKSGPLGLKVYKNFIRLAVS